MPYLARASPAGGRPPFNMSTSLARTMPLTPAAALRRARAAWYGPQRAATPLSRGAHNPWATRMPHSESDAVAAIVWPPGHSSTFSASGNARVHGAADPSTAPLPRRFRRVNLRAGQRLGFGRVQRKAAVAKLGSKPSKDSRPSAQMEKLTQPAMMQVPNELQRGGESGDESKPESDVNPLALASVTNPGSLATITMKPALAPEPDVRSWQDVITLIDELKLVVLQSNQRNQSVDVPPTGDGASQKAATATPSVRAKRSVTFAPKRRIRRIAPHKLRAAAK